jgi:hypothetical protein
VGDAEAGTLVSVESSLGYHSCKFEVLTDSHYLGTGQCQVGSLTGAVAS